MFSRLRGLFHRQLLSENKKISFPSGRTWFDFRRIILKKYLKTNVIPFIVETVFIVSCIFIPQRYSIYTNFLFYVSLLIYIVAIKAFSIKTWIENMKSGREFWLPVIITMIFFAAAFAATVFLENSFPQFETGTIMLPTGGLAEIILFAASTILLPPVVEEIIYRKNMIALESRGAVIVTAFLSMLFFALEHALRLWGIALTMLWALPLSVSYIKTKNIYVPMTAHFIANLLGNGLTVIAAVKALL